MHTGLGALPYAAEFVERVDTSFVQEEKASSGGTASSDDHIELTVRGDGSSDRIVSTCDCERFSCWIHRTTGHCDWFIL